MINCTNTKPQAVEACYENESGVFSNILVHIVYDGSSVIPPGTVVNNEETGVYATDVQGNDVAILDWSKVSMGSCSSAASSSSISVSTLCDIWVDQNGDDQTTPYREVVTYTSENGVISATAKSYTNDFSAEYTLEGYSAKCPDAITGDSGVIFTHDLCNDLDERIVRRVLFKDGAYTTIGYFTTDGESFTGDASSYSSCDSCQCEDRIVDALSGSGSGVECYEKDGIVYRFDTYKEFTVEGLLYKRGLLLGSTGDGTPSWVEGDDIDIIAEVAKSPSMKSVPCSSPSTGSSSGPQETQRCFIDINGKTVVANGFVELVDDTRVFYDMICVESESLDFTVGNDMTDESNDLDTANLIEVRCCCESSSTVDPSIPVTTKFIGYEYKEEPFESVADSATGAGYAARQLYAYTQFPSGGDSGGGTEGWNRFIEFDDDNLPIMSGALQNEDAVAGLPAYNEASAQGVFLMYDFGMIRPVYYKDELVTSFELYDAYTATNQSDLDVIYAAHEDGKPVLDESYLKEVATGQVGTSFRFPDTWKGQWSRMRVYHSDIGGASQFNFRVRITTEKDDGSVGSYTNLDARAWMWHPSTLHKAPSTPQKVVYATRVLTPQTGLEEWYDESGGVTDRTSLPSLLSEIPLDYQPIVYTSGAIGNTYTFENVGGGLGSPYEFSVDGGRTWSSNSVYSKGDSSDDKEYDIEHVIPLVRDSGSNYPKTTTGLQPSYGLLTDPQDSNGVSLRITDSAFNNVPEAVSSNNSGDSGGWEMFYGSRIFRSVSAKDEAVWDYSDIDDTGKDLPFLTSNNWFNVNYGDTNIGGWDGILGFQDDVVVEAGSLGILHLEQLQTYYYASNQTDTINIDINVIDTLTNTVLGTYKIRDDDHNPLGDADLVWGQNTGTNTLNQYIPFTGSGNPIAIQINDQSIAGTNVDAAGHYWRFYGVNVYQDAPVSATTHGYRINDRLEFRGVDSGAYGPAVIHRAPDDVTRADKVVITADIRQAGTVWTDEQKFTIDYRLDGGQWITMVEQVGQFQVSGFPYYQNNWHSKPINVESNSTIQVRVTHESDGNTGIYLRLYDLGIQEVIA